MQEKLLEELFSYLQGIKTFTLNELPELVRQILMWETITNLIEIIIFSVLFFLSIRFFKSRSKENESEREILLTIIWFIIAIFSIGVVICSCMDLLEIMVAPKCYLLEYVLKIKE